MESQIQPARIENIEGAIHFIRGQKVILDSDLAQLYGVSTMRLNEQFKRNRERFPADFAFQLTPREFKILISQFAISSCQEAPRREIGFHIKEQSGKYRVSKSF